MDDFWDFVGVFFACVGLIALMLIIGIFIYVISGCAKKDMLKEQQIHECFIQEPRTKECEYILWQEELKAGKKSNSNSGSLATGMLIGTVAAGGIRR